MEEKRQKYPVGRQDFASLREEGCVYVDKTGIIYDLIDFSKYVFLSRPRRFGKSLLLSTIHYYFEGRKDLFEGLKIMELEKEWKKYPVIHLQLASFKSDDKESLKGILDQQFRQWENLYNIERYSEDFSVRFREIIENLHRNYGEKVVILVDEYDNPLINTIDKPEIHESYRNLLKSIYSNLKDLDEHIKFAMLTGVSRFSNTTVFSGLNNLKDITFHEDFSTICGFTNEEISDNFCSGIEKLARKKGLKTEGALELLKQEYDGYHFSEDLTDIYNPYSLLNCLQDNKISNYWVQSAVPEFIVKRLEKDPVPYQKFFSSEGTSSSLSIADAAFDSPVALFYQTGYLTIKGFDNQTQRFRLGIPNKEVDEGLFLYLLAGYYNKDYISPVDKLKDITRNLEKGESQKALERLKSLLANISYKLQGKMTELDFERTLFVIFHVLGFHVHTELETSQGRIDLSIETKDYVYIMELKYDGSAEEALRQIEEKEYALPWKFDCRKLFKIGINFSSKTRNIDSWLIHMI